ncbi:HPr family phosphocarrier protein [Alkaliphilus peptidifermentans]|uniref:PTS HPr component phosphorylation site n=1 Tax=Alkaliphilus peptidifermentans DSM 18978 TaxID=1120976 RepID=A0A1G5FVE6_9FIRM|nr:HPr family phosphocarrier protein [Alkaliphilus peptidifermentans]SCY43141.1 PTS HPr component phosphorylation site [Alkaliphilus peptidifermentans DSM 18978]
MKYYKNVIVNNYKGIHTRVAAIVAYKATKINKAYSVDLFIQKKILTIKFPLQA